MHLSERGVEIGMNGSQAKGLVMVAVVTLAFSA
jgi:hypothetical protein